MWSDILKFLSENKTSLLVNLIAGLVFFVLGPVVVGFSNRKIKKEKLMRAKDTFLDLLENILVNKEVVNKEKLTTLFNAVGRQHAVNMEVDTDLQYLLEDLSLRFETSKHLSPDQKDQYSNRIEEIKTLLENKPENKEKRIPKSIGRVFEELEVKIESGDKVEMTKQLNELKIQIEAIEDNSPMLSILSLYKRGIRKHPILSIVISIVILILYVIGLMSIIRA